jgi:hypothetical protein
MTYRAHRRSLIAAASNSPATASITRRSIFSTAQRAHSASLMVRDA